MMKKNIPAILLAALLITSSCGTREESPAEPTESAPPSVILLIGDGMGLSQVSSAFYFKDGERYCKKCGLVLD